MNQTNLAVSPHLLRTPHLLRNPEMMPKIASAVVCALIPGVAVGANLRRASPGRLNNAAVTEQGMAALVSSICCRVAPKGFLVWQSIQQKLASVAHVHERLV